MLEIKVSELTDILENVKEAVDKSSFGPVYQYSHEINPSTNLPNKIVSPLGAQIFATTLTQVLQKMETIRIIPDKSPLEE